MAIARRTVNLQHLFRGTSLVKKAPPLRTRGVQRGLEMKDPHELQDLTIPSAENAGRWRACCVTQSNGSCTGVQELLVNQDTHRPMVLR